MAERGLAVLLALLIGSLAVGCGEEGAASGATVTVYVSAPLRGPEAAAGRSLCESARAKTAQAGGEAGDLKVKVVCLDAGGPDGGWTLARVGANARRATEDSTAVAYVGEPDREARRQSRPILDAAGIAAVGGVGGGEAMAQILAALGEDDQDDPRDAVFDALG